MIGKPGDGSESSADGGPRKISLSEDLYQVAAFG